MTTSAANTPAGPQGSVTGDERAAFAYPPITKPSVEECLSSTKYWISVLPHYANDMQSRADRWAITSGLLSAIAGLSVWATIDKSTRVEAQVAVAVVSITSAIAALVPRVKNYGEMAGQARQLSSSYGRVEGHLFNAYQQPEENWNYEVLQRIVEEFDSVKSSKDTNLRDLPPRISYGRPPDSGWPPDTYYRSRQEERQERHRYRRLGFRPRFWRGPNLGGAARAEQAVVVAVVADVPAGDTGALQEYERQVLPALESHGGRVERSLRSADNRSQVHIISFASRHNYESYLVDRAGAPAAAGVEPRLLDVADLVPPGHN